MRILIIGIILLGLLNLFMVFQYWFNTDNSPVEYWKRFMKIRNVFGKTYGIVLLLLCLPSIIIFYVLLWLLMGVLIVNFFGIKEEYKVLPRESYESEEEEIV